MHFGRFAAPRKPEWSLAGRAAPSWRAGAGEFRGRESAGEQTTRESPAPCDRGFGERAGGAAVAGRYLQDLTNGRGPHEGNEEVPHSPRTPLPLERCRSGRPWLFRARGGRAQGDAGRSEEHTSELQ